MDLIYRRSRRSRVCGLCILYLFVILCVTDAPARPRAARRIAHIQNRRAAMKRLVLSQIDPKGSNGSLGNSRTFCLDSPEIQMFRRQINTWLWFCLLWSLHSPAADSGRLTRTGSTDGSGRLDSFSVPPEKPCLGDHLCTCQSTPPPSLLSPSFWHLVALSAPRPDKQALPSPALDKSHGRGGPKRPRRPRKASERIRVLVSAGWKGSDGASCRGRGRETWGKDTHAQPVEGSDITQASELRPGLQHPLARRCSRAGPGAVLSLRRVGSLLGAELADFITSNMITDACLVN